MRNACLLIRPREDWGVGRKAWDPWIKEMPAWRGEERTGKERRGIVGNDTENGQKAVE